MRLPESAGDLPTFFGFALQCLRWAKETHDERRRKLLFELAKQFLQSAMSVEKKTSA